VSEDETLTIDIEGRSAVVARFETWARAKQINKPTGRHVVRFCADMWVAQSFPGDLGIPTVWGILRSANAFTWRRKRT
jgi:hypothetical protein